MTEAAFQKILNEIMDCMGDSAKPIRLDVDAGLHYRGDYVAIEGGLLVMNGIPRGQPQRARRMWIACEKIVGVSEDCLD